MSEIKEIKIVPRTTQYDNTVAKVMKIIAILEWIGGAILGFIMALQPYTNEFGFTKYSGFSFSVGLMWWIGAFICGLLFIAIGEIIQLLDDNQKQTYIVENFDSTVLEKMIQEQTEKIIEAQLSANNETGTITSGLDTSKNS